MTTPQREPAMTEERLAQIRSGLRTSQMRSSSHIWAEELIAEVERLRALSVSGAAEEGAPKTYCAQCWMNGSGKFEMIDDDCSNSNCVLYVRGYKARPSAATEEGRR